MTASAQPDLRQRIAAALRAAAYDCDGDCGLDEVQCFEQHPIQVSVVHFDEIAGVYGYITALADVAAAVVQPLLDQHADENARLREEIATAQAILNGDDQLILCPECVCADCNGTLDQHAPGGNCSCGCDPACDRFIRCPQLDLIVEAVEPITSSPLAEVIAHTAWHALNPAAAPSATT